VTDDGTTAPTGAIAPYAYTPRVSPAALKHWYRDLGALLGDMRFLLPQMWKQPVFSVVTVLSLAQGIAASVTLFSVIYRVLLRPTLYRDADRVVRFVDLNDKTDTEYTPPYRFEQMNIQLLSTADRYWRPWERVVCPLGAGLLFGVSLSASRRPPMETLRMGSKAGRISFWFWQPEGEDHRPRPRRDADKAQHGSSGKARAGVSSSGDRPRSSHVNKRRHARGDACVSGSAKHGS